MKNTAIIDYLEGEAVRFTELAKDIALDLLKNPEEPNAARKRRQAEDHLVRVETFKEAALIVTGHSR